jgi:hypothetical protein
MEEEKFSKKTAVFEKEIVAANKNDRDQANENRISINLAGRFFYMNSDLHFSSRYVQNQEPLYL